MYKFKLLLTFFLLLLSFWSNAEGQDKLRFQFSIATQNLLHKSYQFEVKEENLLQGLDLFQADIYSFQEAAYFPLKRRGLYKSFLEHTKYNAVFHETNNIFLMREGIATVSHFPVEKLKFINLPHGSKFRKRPLLISRVIIGDSSLIIMNVHLTPFPSKRHSKKRRDQVKFISRLIEKDYPHENIIILGDFNEEGDDRFFKRLTKLGFESVLGNKVCTYCKDNPFHPGLGFSGKIDYIFYRPEKLKLIFADRNMVEFPISDHYGVSATFEKVQ